MAAHRVPQKHDHPNGPGARAYFDIGNHSGDYFAYRADLMAAVRRLWPQGILADSFPLAALRVGGDPQVQVDDEFMQVGGCAMSRLANYIATGGVPAHLVRTASLPRRGCPLDCALFLRFLSVCGAVEP